LRSRPRKGKLERLHWTKGEIIDGIFYQLKNGCNWEDLPKDLPPYSTVYWHVHSVARSWSDRTIDASLTRASARTAQKKPCGRRCSSSTLSSVQNTCNTSVDSKGFCFYKATNGIKRHLAVDTLGFPFFTHCTRANVSDDAGLIEMLRQNLNYFQSKPVNIPKITNMVSSRLSPEPSSAGVRKAVSANHGEN
jgi:transposase